MNPLPDNTVLGTLRFRAIYGYFDGPYLFSATNRAGQNYIALALPRMEGIDGFLYVPISEVKLAALEARTIRAYDAFANPEDNTVFEVRFELAGAKSTPHPSNDIPARYLPGEDLELPQLSIELAADIEENITEQAHAYAKSSLSDVLRIGFRFPGFGPFQAPLGELGSVLESLQEFVNALGQKILGQPTDRGKIADSILSLLRLRIIRAYGASFGVEITAPSKRDLFEPSLAHNTLDRLVRILDEADRAQLVASIQDLNRRSTSKLRDFLEEVIASEASVAATFASSLNNDVKRVDFDVARASEVLAVIMQVEEQGADTLELEGALYALNSQTRTFGFLQLPERKRFTGRVSVDAPAHVLHARIQNLYHAKLLVIVESSTATGDETTRYRLLDLTNERARGPEAPAITEENA